MQLRPGADGSAPSEATRQLVDAEVRRIVDECYVKALARLRENRERLESLARALLEKETLDERDAYAAAGFDRPAVRAPAGLAEATRPG
jgi:cell division protease FtsH